MKSLLPIGLLALAACSPVPTGTAPTPGLTPSATSIALASPAAITAPPAEGALPGPSIAPGAAVTAVEVATSLAADGSAQTPATSFDHNHDQKLVVVLTLAAVDPGTRLSYVRYLDAKYVDSRSAATVGHARHFYFEFAAPTGQALTPGLYRLRLYISAHAVAEVSYRVR